jgi:hypothetical protein
MSAYINGNQPSHGSSIKMGLDEWVLLLSYPLASSQSEYSSSYDLEPNGTCM